MKRKHFGRRLIYGLGRPLLTSDLGVHIARQEPGGRLPQAGDRCWRNAAGNLAPKDGAR